MSVWCVVCVVRGAALPVLVSASITEGSVHVLFPCLLFALSWLPCFACLQPQWLLMPSLSHAVMLSYGREVVGCPLPSSMVDGVLARALPGVPELVVEARTVGTCILDYLVHVLMTASTDQLPFLHHQFVCLLMKANNRVQKVGVGPR